MVTSVKVKSMSIRSLSIARKQGPKEPLNFYEKSERIRYTFYKVQVSRECNKLVTRYAILMFPGDMRHV